MVFQFGREVQMPDVARNLELLMTSRNAYSSFSVSGNTRKYHGLFVRNGRLFLAGFDEMVNGDPFFLAALCGVIQYSWTQLPPRVLRISPVMDLHD